MFFSKRKNNKLWKLEYFDTVYKIYDWDKKLVDIFFQIMMSHTKIIWKHLINKNMIMMKKLFI